MARTRVFVSSAYYDLKQIRNDLKSFLDMMNYDSVLNEFGNIPYGNKEALEKYCLLCYIKVVTPSDSLI